MTTLDARIVVRHPGFTLDVALTVEAGEVVALLGPNGAGKTTAVRVLTTLLVPDAGRAVVDGKDVVKDAAAVRRSIGLAGQSAAIVEELSGRENLEFVGRLFHLGARVSRERATQGPFFPTPTESSRRCVPRRSTPSGR